MIKFHTSLLILLLCMTVCGYDAYSQSMNKMHLFHKGAMIDVYVDKVLYTGTETKHFYMRFLIINKSGEKIGVDLNDYWDVIYPNQWIIHPIERQLEALEYQEEPPSIDLRKERLKRYFFNNKIASIPAGESLSYYRDYDQGKAKDLDLRKGEVLGISFDGALYVTDGKQFELVQCFDEDKIYRTMYLMHPLKWSKVPAGSLIIRKQLDE